MACSGLFSIDHGGSPWSDEGKIPVSMPKGKEQAHNAIDAVSYKINVPAFWMWEVGLIGLSNAVFSVWVDLI